MMNLPFRAPELGFARLLVISFALLTTASAAWGAGPEETVRSANERWNATFNRGDAAGLADLYTADALVIPPGTEPLRGRQEIEGFFENLLGKGFEDHSIEIVEVRDRGDTLYQVARWQARGPDGSGGMKTYGGRLVSIFHRQEDGDWKPALHTWN
ncbi:YybH family protein [Thiohalorhabdus sp. Cl-TMA]|uniref:SgcJ/EcaC family oxidoreductase n=1 Tax=Thiohalorhabdus methylotrophus TaxID=3242694 RepID=A0ABV4TRN5_9GAMM